MHVTGVPGWQTPPRQVSAPLQASLSAQLVPSVTGVCVHTPLASQASAVHGLWSSQLPADDVHTQAEQVPVPQTLGDVQAVPFGAVGFEQVPLVGSQTPATWQESAAWQTTGVPPMQTPA